MKRVKILSICFSIAGLLLLGACSQGEPTTDKNNTSTVTASPNSQPTTTTTSEQKSNTNSNNSNVVESQGIHLEFVAEKSTKDTHLDVFVQKSDNHDSIPNAKVVVQVQTPDGKQQSLDLKYDAQANTMPQFYQVQQPDNIK